MIDVITYDHFLMVHFFISMAISLIVIIER